MTAATRTAARNCAPGARRGKMAVTMAARFTSFREFYPYYLGEHRHPVSRRLHVIGTLAMLAIVAAAVAMRAWRLVLPAVVLAYGCAWVGHFVFEKNRPATFRHPLYSLRGDFAMLRDVLLRRTPW
ncbi:MAG: hypothetical protein NAOJABEB_02795 [Steroidobacteraceae bacterium]|nr:hypothetical protein [Steroidobacteraceae bacterium]